MTLLEPITKPQRSRIAMKRGRQPPGYKSPSHRAGRWSWHRDKLYTRAYPGVVVVKDKDEFDTQVRNHHRYVATQDSNVRVLRLCFGRRKSPHS
eukprot:6353246-Amphidinium_carterae.1